MKKNIWAVEIYIYVPLVSFLIVMFSETGGDFFSAEMVEPYCSETLERFEP